MNFNNLFFALFKMTFKFNGAFVPVFESKLIYQQIPEKGKSTIGRPGATNGHFQAISKFQGLRETNSGPYRIIK